MLTSCHPERQRRVSEIIVEMLRYAQHDIRKWFVGQVARATKACPELVEGAKPTRT